MTCYKSGRNGLSGSKRKQSGGSLRPLKKVNLRSEPDPAPRPSRSPPTPPPLHTPTRLGVSGRRRAGANIVSAGKPAAKEVRTG